MHEHCNDEFHRLEKRLKDFEMVISNMKETSDHIQGQNLVLMSELNKYKERDRQVEQVMMMALHLLVNLAGY